MTLIPWSSLGSLEKVETWVLRDHDCPGPDTSAVTGERRPSSRHLRLSVILESHVGISRSNQLCTPPVRGLQLRHRFPKGNYRAVGWRADSTGSRTTSAKRKRALVDTVPSYPSRMASW